MLNRFAMPARYRLVLIAVAAFIAINLLLRVGLLFFEADNTNWLPWNFVEILGVGLVYDSAAASIVAVIFASLAFWVPDSPRGRRIHGYLASGLFFAMLFALLFITVAEVLFWNEFSSRFNFIAVDYLIYTRETVGNIMESYPVLPILAALAVVTVGVFLALRRRIWTAAIAQGGSWRQRFAASTAIWLVPVALFFVIGDAPRDVLPSSTARELGSNGPYEFVRALRSNELDFHSFYLTLPQAEAAQEMRHEFQEAQSTSVFTSGSNPLLRQVSAAGPRKPLNVVLVTMESFGAELTESLGGRPGLSPNLDRLGREGMFFTQMYATGTRTVRGLEAISLSIPPTPGQAIVTRKNNKGYQTLGGVLKAEGYDPVFIYGGYSYFDNMQDFFGGNGYDVVDRLSLPKNEITHETIWGVADEDLFKMVLREMDTRHANGKLVFAHVMTTSNHRPFTYPAGRIDIKSGSGRNGAAKYADWAIGNFMREAANHPWFKDTLFLFVADHTSDGRGHTDLPVDKYRIPLIIYAPDYVKPARIDSIASQIDIGPTLLALLNVGYTSRFFGQDILTEGQHHQRAVMTNYLTVGHLEDGVMVELSPNRHSRILDDKGHPLSAQDPRAKEALFEAIAHFQVAADSLKSR